MDIAERVVEAMSSQGTRSFLGMAEALRKLGECRSSYSQDGFLTVVNEDGKDSYNRESFDSLAVKAAETKMSLVGEKLERTTIRKRNTDDHDDKDASSSSEKKDIDSRLSEHNKQGLTKDPEKAAA
ncbi:hypothetical protein GQ600_21349 [Phytophthora cactorum]|nr:hypothetical protein GQ600_21349 [Phytophthora cactorum]